MSFLMTKVGLNVLFSINQSVSHHNIMLLLPYVFQLYLVPPAIMVWIFVWKYIFEPFIHILQLSRSTNFCF
jgi:membrane-bound acyltransferase YfiQ involved in biofilm formation